MNIHHLKTSATPRISISSFILWIARETLSLIIDSMDLSAESDIGDDSKRRRKPCSFGSMMLKTFVPPFIVRSWYHLDFKNPFPTRWISLAAPTSAMSTSSGATRTTGPRQMDYYTCRSIIQAGGYLTIFPMQIMNVLNSFPSYPMVL